MPNLEIADLNSIYEAADLADKDVFAEMRSNVLLVAGDHYTRASKRFQNLVRSNKDLTETQKLRLTKNHSYRISKTWKNSILAYAPGVAIKPQRDTELQDRKAADMNYSVYQYYKNTHRLKEHYRDACSDFVDLAECCTEILFDYNKGELIGYEQQVDENGEGMLDQNGEMLGDNKKPVFTGDFVFNRVYAFNLLRDPSAPSMRESKYLIVRSMGSKKDLLAVYGDDPDKKRAIEASAEEEFIVFDASKKGYEKVKDNVVLRKYYWRPCFEYPEGYFIIATDQGKLAEGPLPGGIFPIVWGSFDDYPTNPRGRSIHKTTRPYQGEINRASSQMATHQITIADDKILYQAGTKLAQGALLPGVRGLTYQGAAPEILPGRTGEQFLPYIQQQIEEMYQAAMLDLADEEVPANLDPQALLFRAASQQKRFKPFIERFEQYLIDFTTTFLSLAKFYLPDDILIPAVGRSEMVNMSEFRNTMPIQNQITVEAQDDTIETKLGRHMTYMSMIQYGGAQLTREDLGKLAKHMPYANTAEHLSDLTIDSDVIENAMLALERGEEVHAGEGDDPEYCVKRLNKRMREADFQFLHPAIQAGYKNLKAEYLDMEAAAMQAEIDAKNEFIPADGPLIACDLYVENEDPTKAPKRVRIPERALSWTLDRLEKQGASIERLESMNANALAELAQRLNGNQLPPGAPGEQALGGQGGMGDAMPGRIMQ